MEGKRQEAKKDDHFCNVNLNNEMKMKRFISVLLLLVAIACMITTSSCSKDDEVDIAAKMIIGKWKKVKQGDFPWYGQEKNVIFQDDGIVIFRSQDYNYQRTYTIQNTSIKDGKIYCIVMVDKDDETDLIGAPYECMLQDSIMTLNNMNMEHIMDATEHYVRIK